MNLTDLLSSDESRQLNALSLLAQAGLALHRGNRQIALLLAGAAVLAYRVSWLGIVAQLAIRLYKQFR